MQNQKLLTASIIAIIFSVFMQNEVAAQRRSINVSQIDSRFTLKVERYFSKLGGSEEYYYYVQNNTSQEYKIVVNITLELACVGTKNYKLGYNKIVYLKPNATFTPKDDWVHILTSGADNFKNCRLVDGDSYTLYKGLSYTITDVVNVTEQKNTTEINKKNKEDGKDTKPNPTNTSSTNCNSNLPQVLIGEDGEYFWKLKDGSYKPITKEQYKQAKNIPDEPKKEKYIQDCTGRGNIRFKAQGVQPTPPVRQ